MSRLAYETRLRDSFDATLREASAFFMAGISAPGRLRDLADVQELIRAERLDESFAAEIDPSVRAKFLELVAGTRS